MSIRREGGPGKAVKYGFGPRLRGLLGVLAATAPLACSSPDARGPHTDALPRAECGALAQGQEVGSSVVCGRLEVPADWDAPDGPSFELAVTHFFPREARPPAVLVLLGGPGDTTDGYAPYLTPDVVDGFGHELVFFDQRGTGRSEPRPECFELDGARFDSSALPSLAQCSARLAKEGVDAALFSTFQSVRDIDALRGALGYDRVGLLGMSYGTRLALQAMRDLGPTLESVVIDSVTPPQLLPFETLPTAVNDAVARMIDACAKSASCNAAHPDLGGKLDATLAALPLPDNGPDGGPLTRALFAAALITIQGRDVNAIDDVPAFVDRAHDDIVNAGGLSGETRTLLSAAWSEQAPPTLAMYYSVTCSDNQHADPKLTASSLASVRPGFVDYFKGTSDLSYAACQSWPVRPVAADRFGAVQSSVPTLLLNARYDTITPATWAEASAQTLSHSTLVEITRAAHITVSSDDTGCALGLASRFFDSPSAELDASCAH